MGVAVSCPVRPFSWSSRKSTCSVSAHAANCETPNTKAQTITLFSPFSFLVKLPWFLTIKRKFMSRPFPGKLESGKSKWAGNVCTPESRTSDSDVLICNCTDNHAENSDEAGFHFSIKAAGNATSIHPTVYTPSFSSYKQPTNNSLCIHKDAKVKFWTS